jgi:inner membrane transporter RhtA
MSNLTEPTRPASPIAGIAAAFGSQVSMNLGAGFAKHLFPLIGAYGMTAIRIALAALLVILLRRSWRRHVPRDMLPALLAYGMALGLMNILIYQAFARIPIGIATGIEVIGPLTIVLLGSRQPRDFIWLAAAIIGLLLLLPLRVEDRLDPVGIAFAMGAALCWALYIVFGKRVADRLGGDAAAWGMLAATALALPIGLYEAGAALFAPTVLLMGLGIAVLSSALPYTLEMEAMRRLPAHIFGILLSASPAIAALAGFVVLGERLTLLQWIAILCIITASAGSALSASRGRVA